MELLRRVVGLTREPNVESQSKKDKLLEAFVQGAVVGEGRRMVYPSLLQVVKTPITHMHLSITPG